MSNIGLILKNYFRSFIGNFVNKKKESKYLVALLICGLASIGIIGIFFMTSWLTASVYTKYHAENPTAGFNQAFLYTTVIMGIMMLFLILIMRAAYPAKSKDFEMLYSLPLKKSEIVLAKTIYNYLFDMLGFMMVFYPSIIIYAIAFSTTPGVTLLYGLVIGILLPLLSNGLAIFIGYIFEWMAGIFRHFSIFQTLFVIVMIGLYMVVYFQMSMGMENKSAFVLKEVNLPVQEIMRFLLYGDWVSFVLIFSVCFGVFFMSVIFRSYYIDKTFKQYKNKKKNLCFKEETIFKSLFKKEVKSYFSSTTFMMNTIIGIIFYLAMAIVLVTRIKGYLFIYLDQILPNASNYGSTIIIFLLVLLITMTITTSCSISLEGKYFWVLRSLPIDPREVFKAKIALNLLLTVPAVIVSLPLLFLALNGDFGVTALGFILILLSTLLTSIFGLIVNLNYPKMIWNTEEEVIKRSVSPILGLFGGMVIGGFPFIVFFVVSQYLNFYLGLFLICLFDVVLYALFHLYLETKGIKIFEKLTEV